MLDWDTLWGETVCLGKGTGSKAAATSARDVGGTFGEGDLCRDLEELEELEEPGGYGQGQGALGGGQSRGKGPGGTSWRVRGAAGASWQVPGGRGAGELPLDLGEGFGFYYKGPGSRDVPAQEGPERGFKSTSGHVWK